MVSYIIGAKISAAERKRECEKSMNAAHLQRLRIDVPLARCSCTREGERERELVRSCVLFSSTTCLLARTLFADAFFDFLR